MSDGSKIEWCDATWQPTTGCLRVSPGCGTHEGGCYAERLAYRLEHYLKQPKYAGTTRMTAHGPRWTGRVNLHPSALTIPLHWRSPKRIFVDSMSDLFHDAVPDDFIDRVFGVMNACEYWGSASGDAFRWHTFQVLTKRSRRMREYLSADRRKAWARAAANYGGGHNPDALYDQIAGRKGPPPHIWCGVSAENQEMADERVLDLIQTNTAVRFVSVEPMIGPIDLTNGKANRWSVPTRTDSGGRGVEWTDPGESFIPSLDQVIVGCESGPNARPLQESWVRLLRDQCERSGTAFFLKQMKDAKGRKISLPMLDGVQHAAFPNGDSR